MISHVKITQSQADFSAMSTIVHTIHAQDVENEKKKIIEKL